MIFLQVAGGIVLAAYILRAAARMEANRERRETMKRFVPRERYPSAPQEQSESARAWFDEQARLDKIDAQSSEVTK